MPLFARDRGPVVFPEQERVASDSHKLHSGHIYREIAGGSITMELPLDESLFIFLNIFYLNVKKVADIYSSQIKNKIHFFDFMI